MTNITDLPRPFHFLRSARSAFSPPTTSITRRDAIARGGRAALAASTVTAAIAIPIAASARATSSDQDLVALERQWLDLKRELADIGRAYDAAETAMPPWARPGPNTPSQYIVGYPAIDLDHPAFANAPSIVCLRPSLEDIQRLNGTGKMMAVVFARNFPSDAAAIIANEQAKAQARIQHWRDRQQAKMDWERRVGLVELSDRSDAICDRMTEIEKQILQTPARSQRGIGVKLRVWARAGALTARVSTDTDLGLGERTAISALEDLERLAGRAGS